MCRYYKIRELENVRIERAGDFDVARAEYRHHDRTVAVMSARARARRARVRRSTRSPSPARSSPTATPPSIDLYLRSPTAIGRPPTSCRSGVRLRLDAVELPGSIRRVAVIASHPRPTSPPQQLTFRRAGRRGRAAVLDAGRRRRRPRADRFTEDVKFRGLHPMIARRLQMWRLSNFDIARLPSIDDVYAFDCVARDNAADRRLIAVAEVRDLTAGPRRRRAPRSACPASSTCSSAASMRSARPRRAGPTASASSGTG